jgi:hypothetical protein
MCRSNPFDAPHLSLLVVAPVRISYDVERGKELARWREHALYATDDRVRGVFARERYVRGGAIVLQQRIRETESPAVETRDKRHLFVDLGISGTVSLTIFTFLVEVRRPRVGGFGVPSSFGDPAKRVLVFTPPKSSRQLKPLWLVGRPKDCPLSSVTNGWSAIER